MRGLVHVDMSGLSSVSELMNGACGPQLAKRVRASPHTTSTLDVFSSRAADAESHLWSPEGP